MTAGRHARDHLDEAGPCPGERPVRSSTVDRDSGVRLGPRSVDVWIVELRPPTAALEQTLADDELAQAARIRDREARWRFAAGRAQLRALLASYGKTPPGGLRFDRRCKWCGDPSHGKPSLAGAAGLRFNASWAGSLGVVAVAREIELGVDVELIDSRVDWEGVGGLAFSADERARVDADRAGGDGAVAATRIWCRKEAAVKAIGLGLALDLRACRVAAPRIPGGWRSARLPTTSEPVAVLDLDLDGLAAVATLAVVGRRPTTGVMVRRA